MFILRTNINNISFSSRYTAGVVVAAIKFFNFLFMEAGLNPVPTGRIFGRIKNEGFISTSGCCDRIERFEELFQRQTDSSIL